VLLLSSTAAFAQPAAQGDTVAPLAPLAPGEIQKLLEGYAIVQAQEYLGMTDAEFGPFLPKLRALQDTRRRNEQERVRLLMELRRITNGRAGQVPDSEIRERVRALRDLQTKALNDLQHAYDSIDQSLDARQQARFRIFEQEIEQRKLQLLMRARQQNRANRPPANQ
jgi:hypothetical protein